MVRLSSVRPRAQPALLHGPVGAKVAAAEFGVDDVKILEAIALHTTGGAGMGLLARIVYLADAIEPGRSYPGVDVLRNLAKTSLERALLAALDDSIAFIVARRGLIHPGTVEARNWLLLQSAVHTPGI